MTDLADYNLAPGDPVRFRRKPGGNWTEARVLGINKDGSIDIGTGMGGVRSLLPDRLETKITGKRGGTVWQAVVPVTANEPECSTRNRHSLKNSTTH